MPPSRRAEQGSRPQADRRYENVPRDEHNVAGPKGFGRQGQVPLRICPHQVRKTFWPSFFVFARSLGSPSLVTPLSQ
jgi:hypothetical protein